MTRKKDKSKKELTFEFEPEFDLQDDEWLDIEDQMLEETAEKFGNEYEVYEYHLEARMMVSIRKKGDQPPLQYGSGITGAEEDENNE